MKTDAQNDPISFEVIKNALLEAAEEMAVTLRRSAYSTNIKTRADFSCAILDARLQVVAQAFTQPVHLGSMVQQVPRAVLEYGADNLGPGDAILSNYPYPSAAHLNDITLISPVYLHDRLFGYVANLAHHVDVGGGSPASIGAFREVFQEGVIIPPTKFVRAGEIVPDVFRLILAQIRSRRETAGDFRAQVAANHTGARRLHAILERHGQGNVSACTDELLRYTEDRTRAEIAKLPRGTFAAEGSVDNDGFTDRPVHLTVRVVIDDGVLFDLTGCDVQRRAPVNSTFAQTFSACAFALKCLIDPDVPTNSGFYRHVRLQAPTGTVVNCTPPAPVVGGWETQTRLTDVIFKALAPALPLRMPAGTKAMQCHAGFGGIHPDTGEYWCFLETLAGGFGGRATSDGPDAVQTHGQNTENAPIEETELNYPVRILRYELVDDSGGAGKFCGGLGLRRDYLFPSPPTPLPASGERGRVQPPPPHPPSGERGRGEGGVTFTVLADRDRAGPHGLFGGEPGKPAEYILNPDGDCRRLGSKVTIELEPGDVVSYRTCGGGGYGPPHQRDPQLVLEDVVQGKVSLLRAREVFGVAIDPVTSTVKEQDTAAIRSVVRKSDSLSVDADS